MAIVYQISLNGDAFDARGKDWVELEAESECKRDTEWKDPILDRHMLKAEFGCSVSHLRVWRKIANSGLNGIILEEDAIFESIDVTNVDAVLKYHDSAWLGYRKNSLGYWYNCHAYALTPTTARLLIDGFSENIIPVDEWVPLTLLMQKKKNYFFEPERVKQIPRSIRPSTIEAAPMQNHVLTIGTDKEKMWALEQSANRHGITYLNLGHDATWEGGTMEGQGGGQKINMVVNHIDLLPDDDLILFVDGYDVIFTDNLNEITHRFNDFECDILFAAEKNCWPEPNIAPQFPTTRTPYKYLNSGVYMGKAGKLKRFFSHVLANDEDDQLWMQKRFLESNELTVKLDHEGYIFQCDDDVNYDGYQISNGMCCPCIYHGNGGADAKIRFANLASRIGYVQDALIEPDKGEITSPEIINLDYEEVAKDILVVPFLSEEQCKTIIQKAEGLGNWASMEGDKFPAQEIRIDKLGMWDIIEDTWSGHLGKVAELKWHPMEHIGLRDAFVMKYTMDTQRDLPLHTDASLVTGSVKLNDDYDGADLVFPHQNFSNVNVPIGHCILFPSQVTHGHEVTPLTSGEKYSFTMWTSRYRGDVN